MKTDLLASRHIGINEQDTAHNAPQNWRELTGRTD